MTFGRTWGREEGGGRGGGGRRKERYKPILVKVHKRSPYL
jgi:hypothetical protein